MKDSLSWKVNLLYTMVAAVDILLMDIDGELRRRKSEFKQESKQALSRYLKSVADAGYWYERSVYAETVKAVKGQYGKLDDQRTDANEFVRLLMLYVDRTGTEDGYEKVFKTLRDLPSSGLFSEEDIAKFYYKKK